MRVCLRKKRKATGPFYAKEKDASGNFPQCASTKASPTALSDSLHDELSYAVIAFDPSTSAIPPPIHNKHSIYMSRVFFHCVYSILLHEQVGS